MRTAIEKLLQSEDLLILLLAVDPLPRDEGEGHKKRPCTMLEVVPYELVNGSGLPLGYGLFRLIVGSSKGRFI